MAEERAKLITPGQDPWYATNAGTIAATKALGQNVLYNLGLLGDRSTTTAPAMSTSVQSPPATGFETQRGLVNRSAMDQASTALAQPSQYVAPAAPTISSGLTGLTNPLEGSLTYSTSPTSTTTQPTSATPQPAGLKLMNPLDQKKYDLGGMQGLLATQSPNVTRNLMRTDNGQYMVRETVNGFRNPPLMTPVTDVSKYRQLTGYDAQGNPVYSTGAAELAAVNAGISDYNRDTLAQQTGLTNQWQAAQGGIPLQQAQAAEASAKAATAPEDSRTQGLLRTAMARQADAAANQGKYILGTEEVSAGRNPITQQQEFRKVSVPYSARTGERVVTARERLQDIMSNLSTEQQSKLRTELGGKNLSDAELLKQVNTILYGE